MDERSQTVQTRRVEREREHAQNLRRVMQEEEERREQLATEVQLKRAKSETISRERETALHQVPPHTHMHTHTHTHTVLCILHVSVQMNSIENEPTEERERGQQPCYLNTMAMSAWFLAHFNKTSSPL